MRRLAIFRNGAALVAGLAALAACGDFDPDFRGGAGQFDTSASAAGVTAPAPVPDPRGVLSYPGYQVAVARQGDTVGTIAARLGLEAETLARYNALPQNVTLRQGAVVALPARIGEPGSGTILGDGTVDVSTIASAAIDRAEGAPGLPAGSQPVRHQVQPGETAFSIARTYGVPVAALAEWNGLGPDLALRDGQFLLIPTRAPTAPAAAAGTAGGVQVATIEPVARPGAGSVTPVPPSASAPLPVETAVAAPAPEPAPDPEPVIEEEQTPASDTSRLRIPVQGQIIRTFEPGESDGILISAAAGSDVVAADNGTVAQITRDTGSVSIIVIRHENNLLTVYAGVDDIGVSRGDQVGRGQKIAEVQAADTPVLQFEVREGFEAVNPEDFFR